MPLLCASYLLLDRDEEKAEYYREAYRKASADIKHISIVGKSNDYIDVNRWA